MEQITQSALRAHLLALQDVIISVAKVTNSGAVLAAFKEISETRATALLHSENPDSDAQNYEAVCAYLVDQIGEAAAG